MSKGPRDRAPTRPDVLHARALRAAAKVALFGAGAGLATGCGAEPLESLQAPLDEPPTPDAGAAAVTTPVDAGVVVVGDAGVLDSGLPLDGGAPADSGLRPDAGEDFCDMGSLTTEEYLACCERIGWNWDRGCAAWGPPAPPAMRGEDG